MSALLVIPDGFYFSLLPQFAIAALQRNVLDLRRLSVSPGNVPIYPHFLYAQFEFIKRAFFAISVFRCDVHLV